MPCKYTNTDDIHCGVHCPLCHNLFDSDWDDTPCHVQDGEEITICADCGVEVPA